MREYGLHGRFGENLGPTNDILRITSLKNLTISTFLMYYKALGLSKPKEHIGQTSKMTKKWHIFLETLNACRSGILEAF